MARERNLLDSCYNNTQTKKKKKGQTVRKEIVDLDQSLPMKGDTDYYCS